VIPTGLTAAGLKVLEGSVKARKSKREGHGGQLQANVQQLQSASPVRSMGSPMSSAKRLPCRPANRRIGCSFGSGAVHPTRPEQPLACQD